MAHPNTSIGGVGEQVGVGSREGLACEPGVKPEEGRGSIVGEDKGDVLKGGHVVVHGLP